MTLRPDEDLPLGTGTGHSPDEPVQVEGVPATEGVSAADVSDRLDEDPDLQANRTDVEDSPTGHS
jgi:hypothetical protein